MAQKIIGRKQESKELLDLYKENKPVFAVIYGRRRVGKTFLVRELFQDKMSFYHTGLSPYELSGQKIMEQQLTSFYSSLVRYGMIPVKHAFNSGWRRNMVTLRL